VRSLKVDLSSFGQNIIYR